MIKGEPAKTPYKWYIFLVWYLFAIKSTKINCIVDNQQCIGR
jgi:hypothetical protein